MAWSCTWSIDWGSVPEWVGGIGSAAGVLFVYIGIRRETRRLRSEQIQLKAAQARLIYATVEPQGDEVVRVAVENASSGPAFGVEVTPIMLISDDRWAPVSPSPQITGEGRDNRINGGETDEFYISGQGLVGQTISVDLVFTDRDGTRWRRLANRQPEPYLPDFAPRGRWWRR